MALLVWLVGVVLTVALSVEPSEGTYIIQARNSSSPASASVSLGGDGGVAVEEEPQHQYGNEVMREEQLLLQHDHELPVTSGAGGGYRRRKKTNNNNNNNNNNYYNNNSNNNNRSTMTTTRTSSRKTPTNVTDTDSNIPSTHHIPSSSSSSSSSSSFSSSSSSRHHTSAPSSCPLPPGVREEIRGYQKTVDQIVEFVVHGAHKGRAYDTLAHLVDDFGPRVTGTGVLEEAVDHMLDKSISEGLENVHTEDVIVPRWVRNEESAWMLEPRVKKLSLLGLGGSVSTPPGGITAQVLVVKDFEDLARHASQAVGKIVVYNPGWVSYPATVQYRSHGASRASKVGAVAALVRSVTPFSLNTPHTGQQAYDDSVAKIPVACITVEDAAMMERLQRRGVSIEVRLEMSAQSYPDVTSRNTITEVLGWQQPDEVVVVSGHLDSWDVGQGAMDDGGGAIISWEAGVVLKKLGLRPRRTLRTILWTGEEQGLHGGLQYFAHHQHESDRFQLIMESDSGTFTPQGIGFFGTEEGLCAMKEIVNLLHSINASLVTKNVNGGPDIGVWKKKGVPLGSLLNANDKYFYYHHSQADTLTIEDPHTLDLCLALWSSVAYVAADMSYRLPHAPPSQYRRVVVSGSGPSSGGSGRSGGGGGSGSEEDMVVVGGESVGVGSSGSGGDGGSVDGSGSDGGSVDGGDINGGSDSGDGDGGRGGDGESVVGNYERY
ncbi:hypothetical protein Pmani_038444 [Petrolisthes manimaculis]|uniref:Carboxypeptidase Q n=1 Tax=Petrolisthes manimaculis TaxID=1843537 RepID=A0AAE1TK88_9EUCA|nr:hypothetical protein Pmani_038444 [Petrolisthes manimaculis]